MIWNTPITGRSRTSAPTRCSPRRGSSAAIPGACAYIAQPQGRRPHRSRQARRGVPDRATAFENPALFGDQRRARVSAGAVTTLSADRGRRPLPVDDQGRRRPRRSAATGRSRRSRPTSTRASARAFAESVYGVDDRDAAPGAAPSAACRPASGGRASASACSRQDIIVPVRRMYAESMRLSPRWAAEYRGFWDLPEDFDFDVETPECRAGGRCPARSRRGGARPSIWPRGTLRGRPGIATAAAGASIPT